MNEGEPEHRRAEAKQRRSEDVFRRDRHALPLRLRIPRGER